MAVDRSEIVFFDLETIPLRGGQKWTIIEFGAILLCPQKLVEIGKFRTLIRPDNLSLISETSVKRNGITRGEVASARKFEEVAERIYQILHNRSWAGHNILMADCKWICEAFKDIGRDAPEPKRCFDTYKLLDQKFRSRAGDMKEDSSIPSVLPAPILPAPVISESPGASTSTNPRKRKAAEFLEQ